MNTCTPASRAFSAHSATTADGHNDSNTKQHKAPLLPDTELRQRQQTTNKRVSTRQMSSLRADAAPFTPVGGDHLVFTIQLGTSCGASIVASDYSAPSSP